MNKSVLLEIVTPEKMFYTGQVTMVSVPTTEGNEGFMADHTWCVKLLDKQGKVKFREAENQNLLKTVYIKGGYVDISDHFLVFAEEATLEAPPK